MSTHQKLTTANLLQDAIGDSVSGRRQLTNQRASKTMARFTLLLVLGIGLMLMKCWL